MAFAERAAIMEFDGELPREIVEGLALLDTMPAPAGFRPNEWRSIVDGAAAFADAWGARALALGWSPLDLWGLHKLAPGARHDAKGLAFFLKDGRRVVAMTDTAATIRDRDRREAKFRRGGETAGADLAWKLPTVRNDR